ncbi:MAG: extracellular solute-binding protein [Clostridia bacterium]|nr:extracellular solute-binding protein [Clostridia bacterium]
MKKLIFKRVISLVLAFLMIVSVLLATVSCGETQEDPVSTQGNGDTTVAETETELAYNTVEKENYDRDFAIFCRSEMRDQFEVEGITGELLNDLLYERNVTIQEDFGITFGYYDGTQDEVNQTMQLQVTSGLDDYDMYSGHLTSLASCAQSNYCYDLGTIMTMDLTQPWWDQACYENLTVDGKTYVMTGDIDPQSLLISACFVYNKDLMTELGKSVDELNDLTIDGGWTLDVMYEYGNNVSIDLNGDGKLNANDDRFNLTSWTYDVPYSLFYGAGGKFVTIVDQTPELSYSTQKISDIYEKIYRIIVSQESCFITDGAQYATCYEVFRSGRAMFCDLTLNKIMIEVANQTDDAYGILPIPKYDTNQKEYLSFVNGYTPLVMVAKNESDPDFAGTIIEAMATYNYDNVTPKLFEVSTKLQAAQDPISAGMVDYITRNRIFDLGYFYGWEITNLISTNLSKKQEGISSNLKALEKKTERALETLITEYGKH